MYQLILLIHVFVAICIIVLVLMQQGKGATIGAAFGSGASQTVFGSRGSGSFMFRTTISLVAVFFLTSMILNYLTMHAYKQQTIITLPVSTQKVPARANPPVTTDSSEGGQTAPVLPAQLPARQ